MNTMESIFRVVLDTSWRMACLILVFLALRSLLHGRVSSRVLFWVWIAVAIRLLIPFSVAAKWSPFNLMRLADQKPPAVPFAMPAADASHAVAATSQPTPSAPVPFLKVWLARIAARSSMQWAALAWGIGVTVLLIARIRAHRRFVHRLRRSSPVTDSAEAAAAIVAEAVGGLGVRGMQVTVTDLVGAPALVGIFRPRLLFPPGLLGKLSPHEIQLIVAHELGHHQRRDLLAQALIHATQILHWFNPLVWAAARAARHDCELACDEYVVRRLGSTEPQVYGATLLKILGLVSQTPRAALGLGIVESKQQLKRRIQMIITHQQSSFARTVLACALLAVVAGLSLTRETRAQQPAVVTEPTVTTTPPKGWVAGGSAKKGTFVAGVDRSQTHEGRPSAYIKSIEPYIKGFYTMSQFISAEKFIGKRLRYSAWIKTENVSDGGAHLWFRVDGKETQEQFDNMGSRPVMDTTGWQQYSVVLDVPQNGVSLNYGFFLSGAGQGWISGVKIEEVGSDVPSTNTMKEPTPKTARTPFKLPDAPVNLGFDQV
ncbi:MAG: M56 family metallopeptidase [Opitutaceae bacterium]|nr:M56 family metallopeptidase [Opitutaceae bacterium]